VPDAWPAIFNALLPTVPNRFLHMLMLWVVVVLQTITPFVHAHAGAGRPGDADLLRAHPDVYGDVACHHLIEGGERGAEVKVAQGMPLPQTALLAVDPGALYAVPAVLPRGMMTGDRSVAWRAAPLLSSHLHDHVLSHAPAPPRR
jgi:hypothetical protein